jgi:hypothetical protein
MKLISINDLAITKPELIEYGCKEGIFVNHVLNSFLREVNSGRVNNTKEDLLQLLNDMY